MRNTTSLELSAASRQGGISLVNWPCPHTAVDRQLGAGVTPFFPGTLALLEGAQADGPAATCHRVGTRVRDTFPHRAAWEPLPSLVFCGTLQDAGLVDAIDVQRDPVVSRDNRRINRKAG